MSWDNLFSKDYNMENSDFFKNNLTEYTIWNILQN
jgi:hypothetical protein